MSNDHDFIRKRTSEFLREALAMRYDLSNVRRYRGFDGLSDAHVTALCSFGLNYIYPEWEQRCFQDEAFASLLELLDDPMRLRPLTATALKSFWRLGRQLPRAIGAGKSVIAAFEATRCLENRVVDVLKKNFSNAKERLDAKEIAKAVSVIASEEVEIFINEIVSLMHLLADQALLKTGASVLADLSDAMDRRVSCYKPIEREGMHYALQVLGEGMALFEHLEVSAVTAAIDAVPAIERDWHQSVLSSVKRKQSR